jgi:hypothetical protein
MPDADPEVEVVLAAYEAFARGDIDAATKDLDAEVEWIEPTGFPGGGRRVGPAAVAEVFRFREGRIGRMRAYEAPEEAFAAAPLRRWIDAYRAAWGETNDPDTVANLFTLDDYSNLWLVDLDDEGRARGFTEWWKQWPDDAAG